MPLSALPLHLQDIENNFEDDDQYMNIPVFGKLYRWYQKKSKTQLCFSYRCTEWWAKWRKYPKVIFAIGDDSAWRVEGETNIALRYNPKNVNSESILYLSRIQYYKRWHIALQWPLMLSAHCYFKAKDVPKYGEEVPDTDGKLIFLYWGHFDNDLVYWMFTSVFVGLGWK